MTRLALCAIGAAIALTGCADLNNLNKSLAETNNSLLAGRTMAAASGSTSEARVEVPNDLRVSKAFEAALPKIKSVIGTHKCINHPDGMNLLTKSSVPGEDFKGGWYTPAWFPNSAYFMQHHNKNKCVDVRSIDNVSMLALNVLKFRVNYIAEDSGEAVSFWYLFKKMENGDWLLSKTGTQSAVF